MKNIEQTIDQHIKLLIQYSVNKGRIQYKDCEKYMKEYSYDNKLKLLLANQATLI